MPLQPTYQITLADAERDVLRALVRAHTTPKQIATRAQIILLADEGVGVNETARRVGTWGKMVRCWRQRWCTRQVVSQTRKQVVLQTRKKNAADVSERLADEPRSGAPSKFTPEQICKIVALACRPPAEEEGGPPVSQWSQTDLAKEAVRQGIVKSISQRSVGRFLKRI